MKKDLRPPFPDGVLVVDKPEGPTSHDVVTLTRRVLGVSRIGHTGTLDPLATRVARDRARHAPGAVPQRQRQELRKRPSPSAGPRIPTTRRAERCRRARAGQRPTSSPPPSRSSAARSSRPRRRIPRRTSTASGRTRWRGKPLYSAEARPVRRSPEGEGGSAKADAPARPQAVPVTARHLDVLSFDGETARLSMQVTAGFYVRSLAHDLGEALGCGAVLMALRRTRSGEFGLEPAVPLAEVLQSSREQLANGAHGCTVARPAVGDAARTGQPRASQERRRNGPQ